MKPSISYLLTLILALLALAPVAARCEDQEGCLLCHGLAGFAYREHDINRSFEVDGREFNASRHGLTTCRGCHRDVVSIPHEAVGKVNCGTDCHASDRTTGKPYSHESLYWGFMASVHGKNSTRPITCRSCHPDNPTEQSLPASPGEHAAACAECHLERGPTASSGRRPAAAQRYFIDIHGRLLAAGGSRAPACPDCHTRHAVLPAQRDNSTVSPARMATTCAGSEVKNGERSCHREAVTARLVGMSPLAAAGWKRLPGGWLFYYPGLVLAALLAVRMGAGLRRKR